MGALDSIKSSFGKAVGGVKGMGEGIAHAVEGAGDVLGGIAHLDLKQIKEGAKGINGGINAGIKGAGDALGGAAGTLVGISPAGAAINHMTGGAASRLASGAVTGLADTVVKGREGAIDMVQGLAHGDVKKTLHGAKDFANLASLAIPGAGEANALRAVGMNMAKEGGKQSVINEGKRTFGIGTPQAA